MLDSRKDIIHKSASEQLWNDLQKQGEKKKQLQILELKSNYLNWTKNSNQTKNLSVSESNINPNYSAPSKIRFLEIFFWILNLFAIVSTLQKKSNFSQNWKFFLVQPKNIQVQKLFKNNFFFAEYEREIFLRSK